MSGHDSPGILHRRRAQFDVVIPCYNYGRFLKDAVESVLSQEVDVRVLVIDDASQDNTAKIGQALANQDARVEFWRHETNRGHIATYNEGIDWADSTYFTLLSADDILMPGAFTRSASAFRRHDEIVMVYGRMLNFAEHLPVSDVIAGTVNVHAVPEIWMEFMADGSSSGLPASAHDAASDEGPMILDTAAFYRRHRRNNGVPASGTITRTDLQKRLGGYRPSLPHAGDYEMWLRLAAHGPVGYIPRFQVAVRRHKANMSKGYSHVQDVLQRVLALQELEATCHSVLLPSILNEMQNHLASEAIRVTTVALRHHSKSELKALVFSAKALDPRITRRFVWVTYLIKRTIGYRLWDALRKCMPV